ncbi:hypothetical protein [Actinoplanes sp. URMC 104]|uniref:hypothetical protein n=1 Tax=Actinoplanes sp. URMC 104 TaxID=3423409 RepID=UPI003F1CE730
MTTTFPTPNPTPTALMPIDPAVSPAQVSRVLPIRANLLPGEILAGRNARRTRIALIGAVVIVVAVLAAWYLFAVQSLSGANENLATASDAVQRAQNDKKAYRDVVTVIKDRDTATADLKTLMADDLPWAKTLDTVRDNAKATDVTIDNIGGTLQQAGAPGAAAPAAAGSGTSTTDKDRTVGTLTVTGHAPDKKHIATFIDKLATLEGITDPYLTTATNGTNGVSYALSLDITSAALCGRFTTACDRTGGN